MAAVSSSTIFFHAVLELAAVFGAGYERSHRQFHDALALEQRRRGTFLDLVGQPFHDRGFAHAGIADQHGIVLAATAEDLHHAVHFLLAPDQRIEFAFGGFGRPVDAVLVQRRRFDIRRRAGIAVFFVILRFLAAGLRQQLFFQADTQVFRVEPQLRQSMAGRALRRGQHAEQQVFGADIARMELAGQMDGRIQHAAGPIRERQVDRLRVRRRGRAQGKDLARHVFGGQSGFFQSQRRHRRLFGDQADHQMFRADKSVSEAQCLTMRDLDHTFASFRKKLPQGTPLLDRLG